MYSFVKLMSKDVALEYFLSSPFEYPKIITTGKYGSVKQHAGNVHVEFHDTNCSSCNHMLSQ